MIHHISTSIDGLLGLSDYRLKRMLDCVSDEKGKHPTLRQFKEFLKAEKALGHELLPAKGCDHFDPVKGCLGHEDSKTGDTSSVTLARDTFP